jgi:hypothetical protein
MQVSEAFREAGIEPVPAEGDFRLKCDECNSMQRLQDMERSDLAGVTFYACRSCGRSLVGVKSFKEDAEAREASGYRLNRNVVGSRVDLHVHVAIEEGASVRLIEAAPAFFEQQGY